MAKPNKKEITIRKSLEEQLKNKGASVAHFSDQVDQYMHFWGIYNNLIADINKRGVMYTDVSSVGVAMMKNNPSVKESVMVNRQMLSILKELGLTTDNAKSQNDSGEL